MAEKWKPIAGFVGMYAISSLGRVRSFKGHTPKILKPGGNTTGRSMVTLFKNKKLHRLLVRRLVAEAFVPPYKGRIVGLKNPNDPSDSASNLIWTSFEEIYRSLPKDCQGKRCSAKETPRYVFLQSDGRFRAAPLIAGKRIAAGVHDTVEEAVKAVENAFHGKFQQKSRCFDADGTYLPFGMQRTSSGSYSIQFVFQQQSRYFGTFKNREKAEKILTEARKAADKGTIQEMYERLRLVRQPKYITLTPNGTFVVTRHILGKTKHFGTFTTREEAAAKSKEIADMLATGKAEELVGFVRESGLPRNITAQDNGFMVQFYRNKKRIYVGFFATVKDAVHARDAKVKELDGK